jgi:hypothetical protein
MDVTRQAATRAATLPLLAVMAAIVTAGCAAGGEGTTSRPPGPTPSAPAQPPAPGTAAGLTLAATVPARVTVSGRITYESVPPGATRGLDYARTATVPARGVRVEALSFDFRSVLATTQTDADGNYSFTVPSLATVFIRAYAERVPATGATGPAYRVLDNTRGGALHYADSALFASGTAASRVDVTARTGWDGTRYATARASAPFALLDSVERIANHVRARDPAALPEVVAYWSPQNRPQLGTGGTPDRAAGLIGRTSHVPASGTTPFALYVLGEANVDTDEFDPSVLAAEVGRWYLQTYGRVDASGPVPPASGAIDARLAFADAWPRAFAALATGTPQYRNSSGPRQAEGDAVDLENTVPGTGWYSAGGVAAALYDLGDAAADGADAAQLSPGAWHAGVTALAGADAPVTVHALAATLMQNDAAASAGIAATLAAHGIHSVAADVYADGETNDGGNARNVPPARAIGLLETRTVCSDASMGAGGTATASTIALGHRRFLRVVLAADANVTIGAVGPAPVAPMPGVPAVADANPELVLYRRGVELARTSGTGTNDALTQALAAGTYLLEVYEASNVTGPAPRGDTCFDVTVGP